MESCFEQIVVHCFGLQEPEGKVYSGDALEILTEKFDEQSVFRILNGETFVISAWKGDQWYGSCDVCRPLTPEIGWEELDGLLKLPGEFKNSIRQAGGNIKVENWNPSKSFVLRWEDR